MVNQKIYVPIPVRTLDDRQLQRAKAIASKIPYPVDIDLMQINCPQKDLKHAVGNEYVYVLCTVYHFSLQSTIV